MGTFVILIDNFKTMPYLLKIMVCAVGVCPVFVISSMVKASIGFQGIVISREEWWKSGAGVFSCFICGMFIYSIYKILSRKRVGFWLYVTAFFLFSPFELFCAFSFAGDVRDALNGIYQYAVMSLIIFLYFFKARSVRDYLSHSENSAFDKTQL